MRVHPEVCGGQRRKAPTHGSVTAIVINEQQQRNRGRNMGWIGLVVAAICAVLAGVITNLVLRHRTQEKWHFLAMWAGVVGVLFGAASQLVTPALQVRYEVSRIDESLASNAAFSAIKKHDPLTYDRIKTDLRAGLQQGRSKAELIEMLRKEVSTLVQQRLPRSSDEAATEYMRVMVQEMAELR
jgi:MFS family permease